MKSKSIFAASLFALTAALSINTSAAPDVPSATSMEKVDAQNQMKPDSNVSDKRDMVSHPDQAVAGKAAHDNATPIKTNPWLDKTRHFHPRDGGK